MNEAKLIEALKALAEALPESIRRAAFGEPRGAQIAEAGGEASEYDEAACRFPSEFSEANRLASEQGVVCRSAIAKAAAVLHFRALMSRGLSGNHASLHVGVPFCTMYRWQRRFADFGVQGLIAKKSPGRPRKIR
jgi:hypothetical protein